MTGDYHAKSILILTEAIQNKQPSVLANVVDVKGVSPAKIGTLIVLVDETTTAGTVGVGKLEEAIVEDARLSLSDGLPYLTHYSHTEKGPVAVGALCGGKVRPFIQPFLPPPQLILSSADTRALA